MPKLKSTKWKPRLASKLVRDKIPGDRNVSGHELYTLLISKIFEEAAEVARAKNRDELMEELADVIEVCYSLALLQGITAEGIDLVRGIKLHAKGGFSNGVVQDWFE